jgi:hypothetical protein
VHVSPRALDRLGHRGQRLRAVDQHLDRVARARRGGRRLRVAARRSRGQRGELAAAAQAAHVVARDRPLEGVPEPGIET